MNELQARLEQAQRAIDAHLANIPLCDFTPNGEQNHRLWIAIWNRLFDRLYAAQTALYREERAS